MTRQHDADLCERIRELEERVRELETRPSTTYVMSPPHWCYSGCPIHYPTITWTPQWTWTGTTTTAKGISTASTTYTVGDIS